MSECVFVVSNLRCRRGQGQVDKDLAIRWCCFPFLLWVVLFFLLFPFGWCCFLLSSSWVVLLLLPFPPFPSPSSPPTPSTTPKEGGGRQHPKERMTSLPPPFGRWCVLSLAAFPYFLLILLPSSASSEWGGRSFYLKGMK